MDFINPVSALLLQLMRSDFSFVSQPDKVKFQLRLGQSKPIYQAFQAIRNSSDWDSLTDARKRIVESDLLWMTHNLLSCPAMIKHHLFLTSSDPSRLIVFLLSIISSNKGCCSQWSCTWGWTEGEIQPNRTSKLRDITSTIRLTNLCLIVSCHFCSCTSLCG